LSIGPNIKGVLTNTVLNQQIYTSQHQTTAVRYGATKTPYTTDKTRK